MAHSSVPGTDIGDVRILIQDTDIVPTTDAIFSDEEIQVFLTLGGSVQTAAGLALKAIAADKAKLSKLMRTLNWTQDDRQAASALLAIADSMIADDIAFGSAESSYTDFNIRDIVINRALREQT